MNLKQLVADGAYTVFARMNSENKMKQIESVQYIKQMASVMELNIDEWDIMAIFGTGRGNNLFIDRREINKRMMEYAAKADAVAVVAANPQVDPAVVRLQTEANNMIRSSLLQRVREMEVQRNNSVRDANRAAEQQRLSLARALEQQSAIRALSKNEVDFAAHIRAIQEGGFWKFIKFEGRNLFFRMSNELLLRERNVEAGVDVKVNLGKYDCTYDISSGRLIVTLFENNINIGGTIHPHVSSGNICWGSANEIFHNKVLAFDVSGVMQLLANLLSDYNPENPYKTLYDFKSEQHIVAAIKMRQEGKSVAAVKKFFKEGEIDEDDVDYFFNERDPARGRG